MKSICSKINSFVVNKSSSLAAWASLVQILSFPALIIALIVGYFQIIEYLEKADLIFEFSNPTSIHYSIYNKSNTLADIPSVGFGIFDLDSDPITPLPILCQDFKYLNGESYMGPWDLTDNKGILGHRYSGFAYVLSKNSKMARYYWIYWVQGQSIGAWYIDMEDNNEVPDIQKFLINPEEYIKVNMPIEDRIPIK